MNPSIHLAIIGGDERNVELIHTFIKAGQYQLYLIGYENHQIESEHVVYTTLDELDLKTMDCLLLPINGVANDGTVKAVYAKDKLTLSPEWFERIEKGTVVYTGIMTPFLTEQTKQTKNEIQAIMSRDDVAIHNAVPTTEGTIMLALESMQRTIHDSNTIVLGFGRVGFTVAHKFKQLNADVRVGVRKTEDIARAETMDMLGFHLDELHEVVQDCDLLINTIPALIVTDHHINQLKKTCVIIDLASKPGGIDFDYAHKKDIETIHALGLPGKVAPKTAGQILARTIDQMIRESH